jgi:hypothetical protein
VGALRQLVMIETLEYHDVSPSGSSYRITPPALVGMLRRFLSPRWAVVDYLQAPGDGQIRAISEPYGGR